jgi:hypothetical protein
MGMAVSRPPPGLVIEDRLWKSQSEDAFTRCRTSLESC